MVSRVTNLHWKYQLHVECCRQVKTLKIIQINACSIKSKTVCSQSVFTRSIITSVTAQCFTVYIGDQCYTVYSILYTYVDCRVQTVNQRNSSMYFLLVIYLLYQNFQIISLSPLLCTTQYLQKFIPFPNKSFVLGIQQSQ